MNLSIGTDPEIFLFKEDKFFIPPLINDKFNPVILCKSYQKYQDISEEFKLLRDNASLEFNIPSCEKAGELFGRIDLMLEATKEIFECSISEKSIIELTEEELLNPLVNTFGCDPFLNVYNRVIGSINLENTNLRFAGGHVHIGWDNPTYSEKVNVVKWLDNVLLLEALKIDPDSRLRLPNYGAPGSCRMKKYGVEYRPLSNFWIFSLEKVQWVFENVKMAVTNRKVAPKTVIHEHLSAYMTA